MDSLDSATGPGAGRGARSGWSKPRQISALAGAVAVVGLIAFGCWLLGPGLRSALRESNAPAARAGTFHPTSQQLKTLTIEPVTMRALRQRGSAPKARSPSTRDRATPVYSPYSGRVTRVIADLGDRSGAGRAARRHRRQRVHAGTQRSAHRRGATQARAHSRNPQARAVRHQGRHRCRLAAGAGRSGGRRNGVECGAQPPADPRLQRCADRPACELGAVRAVPPISWRLFAAW